MAKAKVTKGVFDAVKICLESGNSMAQTAKFMKLSYDVVSMIKDAENLEEYKALMYARSEKTKKNRQIAAIKAKEQKAKADTAKQVAEQVGAVSAATLIQQPERQEKPQTVNVQVPYYVTNEMREIKELLKGISNKLAAIVTDLYGTKEG